MPRGLARRRLVIVGAGVVGRSLGAAWHAAGLPVAAVISRSAARARAACRFIGAGTAATDSAAASAGNLLMLATIDRVLEGTARKIAARARFEPGAIAFHCSGALPADAIGALRAQGAAVGSLHPLQTFASPAQARLLLPGSTFAIEGDRGTAAALFALARLAGGRPVRLAAEEKALYHAAAAVASNCTVAVAHLAGALLGTLPSFARNPAAPLWPLLHGTLGNLERLGSARALTGPIVRGDAATVRAHVAALARVDKKLLAAYRLAASVTLWAAAASGRLQSRDAAQIARIVGVSRLLR